MFLPIASRELRVAARKRSTTYVRVAGAVAALLIGGGALLLESMWGGTGSGTSVGRGLFSLLTWLCLAATFLSGLFLTADCLSEEKREGTLGFLFLTDLRGYDVVFGKLLATSLLGFYGLLAILPVVGIALVLGGVTGAQFWRTAVALITVLFVSLASGLFASSFHRDSQKATMTTVFLLVLLGGAGPAADSIWAEVQSAPFQPALCLSSPIYLFWTANAWGRTPYWTSFFVNQAMGWTLLALACFLVRHTWQDRPRSDGKRARRWTLGSPTKEADVRRRLLDTNPVLWLSRRERGQSFLVWAMAAVNVVAFLVAWATAASSGLSMTLQGLSLSWMAWSYLQGLTILGVYLGVATQAGRFMVEGRRSGLLELLLVTPLPDGEVVRGQWRAAVRLLGVPLLVCFIAHFVSTFISQREMQRMWRTMPAPAPPTSNVTTGSVTTTYTFTGVYVSVTTNQTPASAAPAGTAVTPWIRALPWLVAPLPMLTVAANVAALLWFGMWMGLNSKTANSSALKTLVFVQVIPWFIISFSSAMLMPLLMIGTSLRGTAGPWFPGFYVLVPMLVSACLGIGKDIGFIIWARRKLLTQFREKITAIVGAQTFPPHGPLMPSPPPLPPALPPAVPSP